MFEVWKFPVNPLAEWALVPMPEGAKILSAAHQADALFVWAMVNVDAPKRVRAIRIAKTGHSVEIAAPLGVKTQWPDWRFVNSVLLHDGLFVVHVYDAGWQS